jgi:hypothetical protein
MPARRQSQSGGKVKEERIPLPSVTLYPTDSTLDEFVSQGLSNVTQCSAPAIANRFPQSAHWIGTFTLNSMFGHRVGQDGRRFCLAFLRRAEAAFFDYELARQALHEFAESVKSGPKKTSLYFRALHFFEACLAMHWQGVSLFARLMAEKPFNKGDGSGYEKLNTIYNVSKHYDPATLPPHHLHAVWISNEGLNVDGCTLSFSELEDLLYELGTLADMVSSCEWHGASNAKTRDESGA